VRLLTPEQFRAFLGDEIKRWSPIVKAMKPAS
jgi:tripartite-type tricarboxylate transporter receptor subunit TctC